MELTTQCPECGATFDASLEQLQLRKGYIRCINCAYIFDGYESVVSKSARPTLHSVGQPRGNEAPSGVGSSEWGADTSREASKLTSLVSPREPRTAQIRRRHHDDRQSERPEIEHSLGPVPPIRRGRGQEPIITLTDISTQHEPSVTEPDDSARIYVEPRYPDDEPPLPAFLDEDDVTGRGAMARIFWGALTVLGLAAIAAQLTYVYRAQIANEIPALRPVLEQACEHLACSVAYPRRIRFISIIDSSLKALPEQEADAGPDMELNVLLRNDYDKPQQWPTLSLDLVDFSGAVMIRRHLAPSDYLTQEVLRTPFDARSEVQIVLPISVNSLQISGYQLGKYFP